MMEDDLWWKTTDNDADTYTDTDTDTDNDTNTDTDTDTNTDGGRLIIGEVSLQKSFPYSGHMSRCASFFGQTEQDNKINK